jgi:hypothetical protein
VNRHEEATAFTPGPWEVVDGMVVATKFKGTVPVTMKDGSVHQLQTGMLALVYSLSDLASSGLNHEANATLIAAAPDMLAALKASAGFACSMMCDSTWRTSDGPPRHDPRCIANRAAIAKAEGRHQEVDAQSDAEALDEGNLEPGDADGEAFRGDEAAAYERDTQADIQRTLK